ncbi:MAG TPA: VWA domain-containing protein [Pirellulales bacterium]
MSTPIANPRPAKAPAVPPGRLRIRPDEKPPQRNDWFILPSWAVSCAFHTLLVLALGFVWHLDGSGPRGQTLTLIGELLEPASEAGLVEEEGSTDGQATVVGGGGSPTPSAETVSAAMSAAVASALSDAPASDPAAFLPSAGPLGAGGGPDGGLFGAPGGMTGGSGPKRNVAGGVGKTSVFGVEGEGRSFVYVFDRSGSMGGSGRSPLQAAKEQMIQSIESLAETHRFHIVYYNQRPTAFNPAGDGRLAFATESSKNVARNFVRSIVADGATDHELALKTALALGPDAIFFLTDADDPLNAVQMEDIRRRNGGNTAINCIEFGLGRALGRPSFLARLAEQNRGNYGYIDITTFRVGP